MAQYRAVVGLDYPPNKRAEAGDIVSDLPEKSVTWLLASGFIEELNPKTASKKSAPVVEETPVVQTEEIPATTTEASTEE